MTQTTISACPPIAQPGVLGRSGTTQPRGSLAPGVSVSNPTPVVSVTLCDANGRAEFDGLSRQEPEMKEDLHHFLMTNSNGLRCATDKSDAINDRFTGPFVKQGEVCWRLEQPKLMT
jgi:hypothetical protein